LILFVPLAAHHVPRIALNPDQAGAFGLWTPELTEEYAAGLIAGGPCWAGIDRGGRIVGAAGFTRIFPTQAGAWALMGDGLADHARAIVEFVRWQVSVAPWKRIEALTRARCPRQGRFARACGFSRQGELRNHGPSCETMVLFEVVKDAEPEFA
jgi:RimJ/RimL family protein N-acetyltransferase